MYLREAGLQLLSHGAELTWAGCFGFSNLAFESNAVFLDDDENPGRATLAYTSSQQLITYRLLTKEQELIKRDQPGEVSFLTSLRRKDGLISLLCEAYGNREPDLVVLQTGKKQVRWPHSHLTRGARIVQVRMPRDPFGPRQVCVTLSDSPHVLSFWRVDKAKLLLEKQLRVLNPVLDQCTDNSLQLVIGGSKYLKLWEFNPQEGTVEETSSHLVSLKFERDNDFLDIRFLPNSSTFLALVAGNKIVIVENWEQTRLITDLFSPKGSSPKVRTDEFEAEFNQHVGRTTAESTHCERLFLHPHGFSVGGSGGFLALYSSDVGPVPVHLLTAQINASISHVLSGSVSPDGSFLALTCSQALDSSEKDADTTDSKLDLYIVHLKKLENELPEAIFPLFPASQHCGVVKDVCFSHSRTQIATIGEDRHVRIWHKLSVWTGIIDMKLQANPLAVALHPSGFQLAIGFKESFKVFSVLESELEAELDTVAKSCYAVSYSPGGKYLAVNSGGSVLVLSPYTLRVMVTLVGHSSPVRSLTWCPYDLTLASACFAGTVAVWDLCKAEQRSPTFPRLGKVLSAFYDDHLDLLCVLTHEGVVKVLGEAGSSSFELPGAPFSSLLLVRSLHLLLLGTPAGHLRLYLWPFLPHAPAADYQDFPIHSSPLTRIALSEAHNTLITASADGAVVLHTMLLVRAGMRLDPESLVYQDNSAPVERLNTVVLVRTTTVETLQAKIRDLEDSISTLRSQQRYASETQALKHADEIEALRREYEEKLRFEHEYSAGLKREMEAKASEYEAGLKAREDHHAVQTEEDLKRREEERAEEQDRLDALRDENEDLKRRMAAEVSSLLTLHQEVKSAIETDCKSRIEEVRVAYSSLLSILQSQGEKYEVGLQMTEKEYEDELNSEREKLSKEVQEEKEQIRNLKLVNARLNSEKDNISKRDEVLAKELQNLKETLSQTKAEIDELRTRLNKMQEQITEREEVIKKKENTIKELRSFNIHLQNFRFVLDQKIKSLKEDRGPMSEQLTTLQGHIRNMYAELLEEFERTRAAGIQVEDLKSRNQSLLEQNKEMRRKVLLAKRKVALIQGDLVQLVRVTSKETLLLGLKQLVEKHLEMEDVIGEEDQEGEAESPEEANLSKVRTELVHQHDLMKEQLQAMTRRNKAQEHKKSGEMQRKMQENASLIQECNSLRDLNRDLQREVAILKDRIGKLKAQIRDQVADMTGRGAEKGVMGSVDTLRGRGTIDLHEKGRLAKTVSRPNLPIGNLLTELEKNRKEILEQNSQFRKLQEQVSTFINPEDSARPTELPKPAALSHSITLPTLQTSQASDLNPPGDS